MSTLALLLKESWRLVEDRADDLAHQFYARLFVEAPELRTLFPIVTWGSPTDRRRLLGATAIATRSPLVLAPAGVGAPDPGTRRIRDSGQSVMCVWDRRDLGDGGRRPATIGASWSLSMADCFDTPIPQQIRPRLYPSDEDRAVVDRLLRRGQANGDAIVALAPGSAWGTKRWPEFDPAASSRIAPSPTRPARSKSALPTSKSCALSCTYLPIQ